MIKTPPAPSPVLPRFGLIDQARGVALIAMIVYHALWDGLQFGLITWTLERDMMMRLAAQCIAGSFLIISGISIGLAQANQERPLIQTLAFWRRIGLVAAGALLVTIATRIALPMAPIYFGILHHIVLASIVLAFIGRSHTFVAFALCGAVLIVDQSIALPALNHPATIWLGLGTTTPVTADWVPIFPWLAAGSTGLGIAKWILIPWLRKRQRTRQIATQPTRCKANVLGWMGQHSLAIYLIHQPILIGLIQAYLWLGFGT